MVFHFFSLSKKPLLSAVMMFSLALLVHLSTVAKVIVTAEDGIGGDWMEEPLGNASATLDSDLDSDLDLDLNGTTSNTNLTSNYTPTEMPSEAPSEAPSMMPTLMPTLQGGVTGSCVNETLELSENPLLVAELESLLSRYRDQFQNACPFSITSSGCDVTFGSETNITFHQLCQQQGGQIYNHRVSLRCGVPPLDVRYNLGVVPQCIGSSCNITRIENAELIRNSNITNFGPSLDNGACSGRIDSASAAWTYKNNATSATLCNIMIAMLVALLMASTVIY